MAIILSNVLTNMDAGVIVDSGKAVGNKLVATGAFNIASEPALNDVLMYCDLPSNCRPKELKFFNEVLDSMAAVVIDIGIYAGEKFVKKDGTKVVKNEAIDGGAFANNIGMMQSANLGDDLRYNITGDAYSLLGGYENSQLALWELATLEQDPFVPLRIGIEIVGAFDTFVAGKSLLQATYTFKA